MRNRISGLLGSTTPWEIEWQRRLDSADESADDPAELLKRLECLFPGDEDKRARALVSSHPDDNTPETRAAVRRALLSLVSRSPLDIRGALRYLVDRARIYVIYYCLKGGLD